MPCVLHEISSAKIPVIALVQKELRIEMKMKEIMMKKYKLLDKNVMILY